MNASRTTLGCPVTLKPAAMLTVIALALLGALYTSLPNAAAETYRPFNVIVLNGTDPYLPAFVKLDRAIRERIRTHASRPVEFYSETLDMTRFDRSRFEREAVALFDRKYHDKQVDAVIALTTVAFDFALTHADSLWPDAQIVFYGLENYVERGRTLGPRTAGLTVRYEFRETIELGLKLVPNASRLIVIAGSSEFDKVLTAIARSEYAQIRNPPDVRYLIGKSLPELLDEVSSLPRDSIILQLTMFRDSKGESYVSQQVLAALAEVSPAPILGPFETYIGAGAVAGVTAPYADQGHAIGDIVLEALQDPKAGVSGVRGPINGRCIADWSMLQRLELDEKLLPADCEVRFRQPGAWERYGWQISTGLAIILIQAVLITALILARRRRARAELALQKQRAELAHAARLTTLGELTASIAHEINQPLSAILSNADAADMSFESGRPDLGMIRQIIADIRRDDLRASSVVQRLRELMAKKEVAMLPLQMNEAIGEIIEIMAREASRRRIRLEPSLADPLPPVIGDRVYLQQVMLNLIINGMDAMEDTPEPLRRITITTSATDDGNIEVAVCDRGHGISNDELPKLFDSFYTGKAGGLGIGLSIVRSIVEAHCGNITAENNAGVGATFLFTLPVAGTMVAGAAANPVASGGSA